MFPFGGGGGGGGGGKEEEEILARDQKDHPNCSYSKSFSKSCSYSSEKGGLVCESARQIFRVCPNKPPVQILSKNDSSTDSQTVSSSDPGSLFDLFKDLQEAINKSDGSQHPSQSQQKRPQHQQQQQKKKWSIADFDKEEANDGGEGSWRA